ncbi:MAG: BlaI/MecI/CopY family transcriptional regulator [Oscillospiraceae bacterium]|jgi:predicted transcriptional regulator|nr:BlaI/MecI/CopY family transcriptional regulator [Oscillospiraceae bacterium]
MAELRLTEAESRLAEIVWANAPVPSPELVEICRRELDWAKSTTYTILKKLCDKGVFRNQSALVTALMSKDDLAAKQCRDFIDDSFEGSLPKFIAAFVGTSRLSDRQAEEIRSMIEKYKEQTNDE